jgi:two-component system cell cycle response regulator
MTARILVVDDMAINVKLLEARLMAEYFQVLTASNGRDALDICEKGLCDLVLLDVMMPEMDGFEVCQRLKDNPKTSFIPVVMVTALDLPEDRVKGLQCGADDETQAMASHCNNPLIPAEISSIAAACSR